jgi:hypothetical protein
VLNVFVDPPGLLVVLARLSIILGFALVLTLLMFLVGFPAEIFNNTFQENRDKIRSWFRWIPSFRWLRLPLWARLGTFGVVAAALLAITVDPKAGFNQATLLQGIGFLMALPLVVLAQETPGELYFRRLGYAAASLRTIPLALIVAGLLALLSRLAHFDPPYVYGLIAAYLGAERTMSSLRDQGRSALTGVVSLLAVSVIAWFVWIPIDSIVTNGSASRWLLVVDAALSTVFILGLETVVFAMIPMTFLPGGRVFQWQKRTWIKVYPPIATLFVLTLFASGKIKKVEEVHAWTDVTKVLALFFIFGAFSLIFWAYFCFRSYRHTSSGDLSKKAPKNVRWV